MVKITTGLNLTHRNVEVKLIKMHKSSSNAYSSFNLSIVTELLVNY